MNKLGCVVLGMMLATPVFADADMSTLLNKVTLQLHAEKWVTTKTALVSVSVNAAVSDAGIEKIQNQVLEKLTQLSNQGEWHILNYTRQQDKSGLESIQISAQARLPQSELINLRSKTKNLSKPGETYTLDDVQFTPAEEDITQANSQLRNIVYQQAKAEIDTLNKMYPEQKYYLYRIDFNMNMPMPMMAASYNNTQAMAKVAVAPLNVGNKMDMTATVTVASMPDTLAKKSPLMNA